MAGAAGAVSEDAAMGFASVCLNRNPSFVSAITCSSFAVGAAGAGSEDAAMGSGSGAGAGLGAGSGAFTSAFAGGRGAGVAVALSASPKTASLTSSRMAAGLSYASALLISVSSTPSTPRNCSVTW